MHVSRLAVENERYLNSLKSAAYSTIRLAYGAARFDRRLTGGWLAANAALRSGKYSAVSIDCFDTILSRSKPDWEQRAIADLAIKVAGRDSDTTDALLEGARACAARTTAGATEPSALSIWRSFCNLARLPVELADVLCRCELQLLETSSALEPNALDFISATIDRQMPFVVCSDTRWPSVSLATVLHKKGLKLAENALVCSCDHGKSKFRGELFGIATDRLSSQTGQAIHRAHILHVGDNCLSDAYSGACFGMTTILVEASHVASASGTYPSLPQHCLPTVRQEIQAHFPNR